MCSEGGTEDRRVLRQRKAEEDRTALAAAHGPAGRLCLADLSLLAP